MAEKGLLTGHKLAGLKLRLIDGAHHIVDSSEHAFFLATQGAIKQAFERGQWQVLEPIMLVEITGPEEFQVNAIHRHSLIKSNNKFFVTEMKN